MYCVLEAFLLNTTLISMFKNNNNNNKACYVYWWLLESCMRTVICPHHQLPWVFIVIPATPVPVLTAFPQHMSQSPSITHLLTQCFTFWNHGKQSLKSVKVCRCSIFSLKAVTQTPPVLPTYWLQAPQIQPCLTLCAYKFSFIIIIIFIKSLLKSCVHLSSRVRPAK